MAVLSPSLKQLTETVPALSARAYLWALVTSSVNRVACKPYAVALASPTASSSLSAGRMAVTGPKISSRTMAMSGVTPSKMVGGMNSPLPMARGAPPVRTCPPSALPFSM